MKGTIALRAALPVIARTTTISATADGAASGQPGITLDFAGRPGLVFAAGAAGSRLSGLAADNASGNGVTVQASQVTLSDNVIAGNRGSGIVLDGVSGTTVAGNRIGTNPAGTAAVPNAGNGILVTGGSHGNEIGGTAYTDPATGQVNDPTGDKGKTTPVFVVPPLGNLISGNGGNGVLVDDGSAGNTLNGNFIGTTASGDDALGNGGDGVWFDHAPGNALVGCLRNQNPFVYYNVVSGNHGNGLRVTSSDHVTVHANFFGVGADNATLLGNGRDGIRVDGSSAGTTVGGVIPLGNVTAGNGANGIEVAGTARGFTTFNSFDGSLAFKGSDAAAPNGGDGLLITATGGGQLVRTNVFSGNRGNGIELGGDASGVTVDPDLVGTSTNGKLAVPNGGDGVLIDGTAHDNVIGGHLPSIMPQNTFSGNRGYGLAIIGRANRNRVFGAFIGTKVLGTAGLANGQGGVLLGGRAYGNVIGAATPAPSDLISANDGNGVTLAGGATGNWVLNNYIGLGKSGQHLPNRGLPLVNDGRGNVISGNQAWPPPVPVTG